MSNKNKEEQSGCGCIIVFLFFFTFLIYIALENETIREFLFNLLTNFKNKIFYASERIPKNIRLIPPAFIVFIIIRFIAKLLLPVSSKIISVVLLFGMYMIVLSPVREKLFTLTQRDITISFLISILIIFLIIVGILANKFKFKEQTFHVKHSPKIAYPKYRRKKDIYFANLSSEFLPDISKKIFEGLEGGKIYLPFNKLSKTTAIIGSMGSGKSRLMYIIQRAFRKKYPDKPIIINDPKGEWLRTFYNPATDIIFAPFDKRSFTWDIMGDFEKYPELIHSIVSTAVEAHATGTYNRFWTDSAVELLKNALSFGSIKKARNFLIEKRQTCKDDKSFLGVLSTALLGFQDIVIITLGTSQNKLSLDDIFNHKGRIFLLNNPKISAEQRGALNIFLSTFLNHSLSLPDVKDPDDINSLLLIDEVLTFKLPADIETAIFTQCRSKGIAIVAGSQRIGNSALGEITDWYEAANQIFAMKINDMRTRESLSKRIGGLVFAEKEDEVFKERHHLFMPPESFGDIFDKHFLFLHDTGLIPGKVRDEKAEQNKDIEPLIYQYRKEVRDFMKVI